MRVLFVYPVPPVDKKVYTGFNHGIGYLSAVVKKAGHETALFITSELDETAFRNKLLSFKPDLAAFSVCTSQMPLARRLISIVKETPGVAVILGGIHATSAPEDALALPGVDAVCVGEGENAISEAIAALEYGRGFPGIANLITPGKTAAEPHMGPLAELDRLPFPDRDVFPYQEMLDEYPDIVGAEFMASRGCPFSCGYCINSRLNSLYGAAGLKTRLRSVDNVLAEISEVRGKFRNVRLVGFHDDIFGQDREWLAEFCEKYPSAVGLPFWCNTRVGVIRKSEMKMMRKAGLKRLHMGVEAGKDELRRRILNRNITDEQIVETFGMARSLGIKTVAFNMIGIPGETEESMIQTVELNRRIRPDWMVVSIFTPFPGTPLYELCKSNGWLKDSDKPSYYDERPSIANPDLPDETLLRYYRGFAEMVLKG
jgi:anaerobic magnesium-protoporphyrin IX monomethyl ester cyclase